MASDIRTRARDLVTGALVADAAAMGLHWLYDQARIREVAPTEPEFREPTAGHYAGGRGYFAHGGKRAGQPSQYGEQALVMLRSLVANGGRYDARHYAASFRAHFGYGGPWVGYIDHATRETLDNFIRAEEEALRRAHALPFGGAEAITAWLARKAFALAREPSHDGLRERFEAVVRASHDDEEVVAHGMAVLDTVLAMGEVRGARDEQLPAIAKLPGLVAAMVAGDAGDRASLSAAVESAVRVTSDHERAIAYGEVCGRMMAAAIMEGSPDAAIAAGLDAANEEIRALLDEALAMRDRDALEVTAHFGMACDLRYGVPGVVHNIATAPSYAEGVRRNIHAGGDSCGRAMLLGAVLGAVHGRGGERGIPEGWIARLSFKGELDERLSALLP